MNPHTFFLLTIYYTDQNKLLLACISFKNDAIPDWVLRDPESEKAKYWLHSLLPLHVKSCGPIVKVESIFECCQPHY